MSLTLSIVGMHVCAATMDPTSLVQEDKLNMHLAWYGS